MPSQASVRRSTDLRPRSRRLGKPPVGKLNADSFR